MAHEGDLAWKGGVLIAADEDLFGPGDHVRVGRDPASAD